MNFVTAIALLLPSPLAAHHQRAGHPLARHAYRLSQVITYGVASPQTYVH